MNALTTRLPHLVLAIRSACTQTDRNVELDDIKLLALPTITANYIHLLIKLSGTSHTYRYLKIYKNYTKIMYYKYIIKIEVKLAEKFVKKKKK